VPSLHVGFAVVIGVVVAAAVRTRALKVVWLLWGPAIALAVVATGNHYVFDIAAGVVAAGLGYLLGAAVARATPGRRPATARPSPAPVAA
jgi:membrane-associated phospholipid phosphatase